MNKTIEKKVIIKGEKGAKGESAANDITVPIGGMIAIEGEIPEGYELYREVNEGGE